MAPRGSNLKVKEPVTNKGRKLPAQSRTLTVGNRTFTIGQIIGDVPVGKRGGIRSQKYPWDQLGLKEYFRLPAVDPTEKDTSGKPVKAAERAGFAMHNTNSAERKKAKEDAKYVAKQFTFRPAVDTKGVPVRTADGQQMTDFIRVA